MTERDLVLASLASVRAELAETFPHINPTILTFRPAPGMPTLQRVLMDIVTTEQVILERLKGLPRTPDEEMDTPLYAMKDIESLAGELDKMRQQTLTYIGSLSDYELIAPFKVHARFEQMIQLVDPPVSEILRYIARHESYHTGQVYSYLRAAGDDPGTWPEPE